MRFFSTYTEALRGMSRPMKLFLASTVILQLGMSLAQLYLNFFLQALGLDQQWVGVINATPSFTVVVLTLIVGSISMRSGPWRGMILGTAIVAAGALGTALSSGPWWVFAATVLTGAGSGFIYGNSGPFMMAHTENKARATIFSLQAALATLTGFVANMGGGQLPSLFARVLGEPGDSVDVLRVVLLGSALLYAASLVPVYMAGKASGKTAKTQTGAPGRTGPIEQAVGQAAVEPEGGTGTVSARQKRRLISDWGLVTRLVLPGAMIGLGAGFTMPFMNVYIERKFNVDFQGLGQIFAWSAVATAAALMLQPVLAARMGKVKSVALVQALSLPFLFVLGYATFFPLVVASLFVRAALMNMGNPVFSAYSMERIPERERATFSSISSSMWSLGWAAGAWVSGALRGAIGFLEGFNILFGVMATLYAASTVLMWWWFAGQESRQIQAARAAAKVEDRPAAA